MAEYNDLDRDARSLRRMFSQARGNFAIRTPEYLISVAFEG